MPPPASSGDTEVRLRGLAVTGYAIPNSGECRILESHQRKIGHPELRGFLEAVDKPDSEPG
jgi:hypothetical protein